MQSLEERVRPELRLWRGVEAQRSDFLVIEHEFRWTSEDWREWTRIAASDGQTVQQRLRTDEIIIINGTIDDKFLDSGSKCWG